MQIFIRTHRNVLVKQIEESTTVEELNNMLEEYGVALSNIYNNNALVSNMNTEFFTATPVLCGGGNMTETNKMLALNQLKMKICRRCYARNAVKAVRCRKAACGHYADMRMKKVLK